MIEEPIYHYDIDRTYKSPKTGIKGTDSIRVLSDKTCCYVTYMGGNLVEPSIIDLLARRDQLISNWGTEGFNGVITDYTIEDMLDLFETLEYPLLSFERKFRDEVAYGLLPSQGPNAPRLVRESETNSNLLMDIEKYNVKIYHDSTVMLINGVAHNTDMVNGVLRILGGEKTQLRSNFFDVSFIDYTTFGQIKKFNVRSENIFFTDAENYLIKFNPNDVPEAVNDVTIYTGSPFVTGVPVLSIMGSLVYLDNDVLSIVDDSTLSLNLTNLNISRIVEQTSKLIDINNLEGFLDVNDAIDISALKTIEFIKAILDLPQSFITVIPGVHKPENTLLDLQDYLNIKMGGVTLDIKGSRVKKVKNKINLPAKYLGSTIFTTYSLAKKRTGSKDTYVYKLAANNNKKGISVLNQPVIDPINKSILAFDIIEKYSDE